MSDSHQAVLRQSSGSPQAVQSLTQAIVKKLAGFNQADIRQPAVSHQSIIKQMSSSCQAVIRKLSRHCQKVYRQLSGSHQVVIRQSYEISKYTSKKQANHIYVDQTWIRLYKRQSIRQLSRFVIYCAAYGNESLFSLVKVKTL